MTEDAARPRIGRGLSVTIVAFLAIAPYLTSLRNQFAYDDMAIVGENKRLADWGSVQRIWLTDWWYQPPEESEERHRDMLYRPLTMQTLAWNYAVGGLDPIGYHVFNVAAHAVCSVLVFVLTAALFGAGGFALAVGALFAVHPIHTEAVANVVGRAEVLSTLFVVCALWCLARDVLSRSAGRRWGWRVGFWLSFAAGMASKESAVCVLGLAPLCEWWLRRRSDAERPARAHWPATAVRYAGLVALFGLYLWVRWVALGGKLTRDTMPSTLDNPLADATLAERIFTPPVILAKYLLLMVWPVNLSSDYSYNAIPVAGAPWRPMSALGLAIIAGAVVWAVRSYKRDGRGTFIVLAFAISYVLISNSVIRIGTILGERLFYLPSVFVCWAIVEGARVGVIRLRESYGARLATWGRAAWVMGGVLVALAIQSAVRNVYWYDSTTIFKQDVRTQPGSARLQLYSGQSLQEEGRLADAEVYIRRSIEIYPYLPSSHRHLGYLLALQGRWPEAETEYQAALHLRWEYKAAQDEYERWRRYYETGHVPDEAELASLETAAEADPSSAEKWRALAVMRFQFGKYRDSMAAWRHVIALVPDDVDAQFELATLLSIDEQYEESLVAFEKIAQQRPDDWRVQTNLCILKMHDDPEAALEHARAAVRLNPDGFEAQMNLANALLILGKKEECLKRLRLIRRGLPEGDAFQKVIDFRIEEVERS